MVVQGLLKRGVFLRGTREVCGALWRQNEATAGGVRAVVVVGNTDGSRGVLIVVKYVIYRNRWLDMLRNTPEKESVGVRRETWKHGHRRTVVQGLLKRGVFL
jgi:hypothetical protein